MVGVVGSSCRPHAGGVQRTGNNYGVDGNLNQATPEQRGTQHRHILIHVDPDKTYEFQILLKGQGNEFVIAFGGTVDTPSTASPQWIRVEAGHERAVVSWAKSFGAASYIVERADVESDAGFQTIATTSGMEYIDHEVVSGKTYTYRVRSVDPAGNSTEPSPAVRVTAPVNFIVNGSFEEVENGLLIGWRTHVWPNNYYRVLALMGGSGLSTGTAWYDGFALIPYVVADSRDNG